MTVKNAIREFPQFSYALDWIADHQTAYPDADRVEFTRIEPIKPDHPDRIIEPYQLYDGTFTERIEFIYIVETMYNDKFGCIYGIDSLGEPHLWMD